MDLRDLGAADAAVVEGACEQHAADAEQAELPLETEEEVTRED